MSKIILLHPEDPAKLHQQPFALQHGFATHDLFSLPRLVKLAQSLPEDKIEYSSGIANINQTPEEVEQLDIQAEEIISGIQQHNAWMVIKRVESDPAYQQIIEEFINNLATTCHIDRKQFCDLQGFIFISSANATTPFHLDAEENVLLQITGEKLFHVFDNKDRSLVSEQAMEISPSKHRNLPYKEHFEDHASIFTLRPGDGVHVPYMAPHWVKTKDSYCVSIAMTWKTPTVLRANKIRLMNGTLRRYGLAQSPPGVSLTMDSIKVALHNVITALLDPIRKSETMRRLLRRIIYGRKANYYYQSSDK